jgi:hypothetical protein
VFHVNKTNAPFLIVHGTADENVPVAEADDLYEKLKTDDVPVQFLKLEDGHTFTNPENRRRLALETQSFSIATCTEVVAADPALLKRNPGKGSIGGDSGISGIRQIVQTIDWAIPIGYEQLASPIARDLFVGTASTCATHGLCTSAITICAIATQCVGFLGVDNGDVHTFVLHPAPLVSWLMRFGSARRVAGFDFWSLPIWRSTLGPIHHLFSRESVLAAMYRAS